MSEYVLVEDVGPIRVITLNRPRVLNALNKEVRRALVDALTAADRDHDVGCVILTGAGERAFAAGQDLDEAKEFSAERAREWIDEFDALYSSIRNLSKASIAALNGHAVGAGFQMVLLADIRIAAPHAKVGMPEINDGIPCITGTWTLWDLVGRSRTVEIVLTGRLLDMQEALQWGIVHRVVPTAELMPVALSLGRELASKARTAIRMNKEYWRQLTQNAAKEAVEFAKHAHAAAFASGEPRAAMEQFLAKRRAKG